MTNIPTEKHEDNPPVDVRQSILLVMSRLQAKPLYDHFTRLDHIVRQTDSGLYALTMLEHDPPNIIVCHKHTRDLSGLEISELIDDDPKLHDIILVVVQDYQFDDIIDDDHERENTIFLSEDSSLMHVSSTVSRLLNQQIGPSNLRKPAPSVLTNIKPASPTEGILPIQSKNVLRETIQDSAEIAEAKNTEDEQQAGNKKTKDDQKTQDRSEQLAASRRLLIQPEPKTQVKKTTATPDTDKSPQLGAASATASLKRAIQKRKDRVGTPNLLVKQLPTQDNTSIAPQSESADTVEASIEYVQRFDITRAQVRGKLQSISLFDLLNTLSNNHKTGRLCVRSDIADGFIDLNKGQVVHCMYANRLSKEALEHLLIDTLNQGNTPFFFGDVRFEEDDIRLVESYWDQAAIEARTDILLRELALRLYEHIPQAVIAQK